MSGDYADVSSFFRLLEPDLHLIRNPELREAAGLLS